jgi:hypothetical protein
MAHDPFFQQGFDKYTDGPRLRYRRILIPLTAFVLSLGHPELVHAAYFSVILLSVFLGAYWLSAYCSILGLGAGWGSAFVLIPATLVSIERMTVDVALSSLCVGFVFFVRRAWHWGIYAVLVAAPLVRETGFLLIAGYVLHLLWNRSLRFALLFSTAAVPTFAWYLFVQSHTTSYSTEWFSLVPLKGVVGRALHPFPYPFPPSVSWAATILDYTALAGVLLAIVLALEIGFERRTGPVELSIYLFALLAIFLSFPDAWSEVYAFGRSLTPLLLLLALSGLARRSLVTLVPIVLVVLRIGLQYGPQLAGVVRGLLA